MPATVTARLEARLPPDVHALLERAAQLQGRSVTDFVVTAAREAATAVIEAETIVRLSAEDQRRFADALFAPPPSAPAMQRARRRRAELLQPE